MNMGPWSRLLLLCWVLRSGRGSAFLGFCGPGGAGRSAAERLFLTLRLRYVTLCYVTLRSIRDPVTVRGCIRSEGSPFFPQRNEHWYGAFPLCLSFGSSSTFHQALAACVTLSVSSRSRLKGMVVVARSRYRQAMGDHPARRAGTAGCGRHALCV